MSNLNFIDTHCHLDGEEFAQDRDAVIQRAREAGCTAIFLPAIDVPSCHTVLDVCAHYPDFCRPMLGLHPEEVRADWRDQLAAIKKTINCHCNATLSKRELSTVNCKLSNRFLKRFVPLGQRTVNCIAIGEVGLDYYWSREFEQEQLLAFEEQVRWAVELQLPLMIHCRKAQNEMVAIIKRYAKDLPGGVFHCFTGNEQEARQLLEFDRFVLGIGGVLTFKKSHLPETLAAVVPLDRIVLETDAPYMAPVPMRGQRNESAYIRHVITRLAEAYGVSEEEICERTTENVTRVFGV